METIASREAITEKHIGTDFPALITPVHQGLSNIFPFLKFETKTISARYYLLVVMAQGTDRANISRDVNDDNMLIEELIEEQHIEEDHGNMHKEVSQNYTSRFAPDNIEDTVPKTITQSQPAFSDLRGANLAPATVHAYVKGSNALVQANADLKINHPPTLDKEIMTTYRKNTIRRTHSATGQAA